MNRREFLKLASAAGITVAGERAAEAQRTPALVTAERLRPLMTSGVQTGDVTAERAVIWSRTDRPARMIVEYAANDAFRGATTIQGPAARNDTDFTARVDLDGLRPGEMVFYRVRFDSLAHPGARSEPVIGQFRAAPRVRRPYQARLVRRHRGTGLGHKPRAWRPAHLRDDAASRTRRLRALGRHDLCGQPAAARSAAGRRARVEEPGDPGQVEGGRDPGRVPRQLRLQPARRAHAPLQRVRARARAVGRSRGDEQLASGDVARE